LVVGASRTRARSIDSSSFTGLDVPQIGRAIADTTPDVVLITGWYSVTLVRAVGVPPAGRADAVSGRFAFTQRAARVEAAALTAKTHILLRQFDGSCPRDPGHTRMVRRPDHRIFQVPHAVDNEMPGRRRAAPATRRPPPRFTMGHRSGRVRRAVCRRWCA
jgi:hypothetical protein